MKVIILVLILFSSQAFAEQLNDQLGCQELEDMLHYANQDLNRDEDPEGLINNIEVAYKTICRSEQIEGKAIFYEDGQLATEAYNKAGNDIFYPNGELAVHRLGEKDAVWFYPNGAIASYAADEFMWSLFRGIRKAAKIVAPFKRHHRKCAPGCTYVSWGTWGDEAHKKRPSCHNSGEAIDIHAIKCSGKKYGPRTTKFRNYVKCMKRKFYVIFGNKQHKNHAHIQFHNCKKIKLK